MADSKKYNGSTWQHSLHKLGTSTDTITTLPADVYAEGDNATVGLVGNMVQAGTPTPDNPIQPQECGENTGNLFDANTIYSTYKQSDGTYQATRSVFYGLKVKPFSAEDIGKTFTYAMSISPVSGNVRVCGNIGGAIINGDSAARSVITFAVASVDDTLYFNYGSGSDVVTTLSDIMLNSGSTVLPYEPYGYKLAISSASTTTPVYLGEAETTRKIKKLVLTGEEMWEKYSSTSDSYLYYLTGLSRADATDCICTHTLYSSTVPNSSNAGVRISDSRTVLLLNCGSTTIQNNTKEAFKAWLAQQYAAGTPVCVWYVLATPTTGIVNEPIRKIGDYVDTVSGVSIPTITGADSFDVQTTLKPSEVSLSYTGWHNANVGEWDGSEWQ